MSHVIGIDIGTSGIKIGAMTREGQLEFISNCPYSLSYPKDGWIELDLEVIWEKTKTLLLEIIEKVNSVGKTEAISLSTFCNSTIFFGPHGEVLSPGIIYLDQRSKQEAEWIKAKIGIERLTEITKNRIEPGMYTVTTLLWFKNHFPELYNQSYKWGNLSTFILNRLTGAFVMDWTQASFSGIYDVRNYKWSEALCDEIGINQDLLPDVVDPCEKIGELVGFQENLKVNGIPVVAGAADTACSTLSLGIQPNEVFESVGTSNVLTLCTENPDYIDTRFLNRCHVKKNQWLTHGAMSTPGASVKWYYNTFYNHEKTNTSLEELAKNSPIGSNGVFFLPYMQGERTPIWDQSARGVFLGLHLNTSKEDMFRGILEGCALGLRQINEIIETEYKINYDRFQSIGGGAKNKVWVQIKANVLNKKIEIKSISETAVYGACIIASTAVHYFDSLETAVNEIQNQTIEVVEPQYEDVILYNELYEVYRELYPALKDVFQKANSIQSKSKEEKEVKR